MRSAEHVPGTHPISDDFDINKLLAEVRRELDKINEQKTPIIDKENIDKIIFLFRNFNNIYEDIMSIIELKIQELNLSTITIIEHVVGLTNLDYCFVKAEMKHQWQKINSLHGQGITSSF